jgi:hypothetical protein
MSGNPRERLKFLSFEELHCQSLISDRRTVVFLPGRIPALTKEASPMALKLLRSLCLFSSFVGHASNWNAEKDQTLRGR